MHHLAFLASLLPLAAGHGFIASPPARRPGNAYKAACGEQPFYQQSSDINGNVQGIQQVVGADKTDACNLWLCKGFVLEDNTDKVQSFALGQTIDFQINIAAPHTGYANVSVVKTSTNAMIGIPLIEFDNYASNAGVSANNSAFSVTLPSSLGSDCATAGDCVLQWFWNAPDIDQTYEACVDFTVSGGGGSGSAPSSAASSSAPATSQAAATSTSVAAVATSVDATVPTTTSVDAAPTATTTPVPDETGDDECPADEDDSEDGDEGEEEGDDEECPADDGEGDEDEEEGDDEECPADGGEDDETEVPAGTSSAAASPSPSAADVSSSASTVTQVVTSTVTTERLVTVTAAATACN
ncbi:hypothetical protein C8A01DRAFT_19700 [Parachaetomium inaequale]|uniref:Chitin-binding type-4 domain-containing protein n=1 Tax=Parachaetomium inaequale TaxID=2588326 RepID=A0AAN6P9M5_9PEZI|nr:hypothetical protein C8A01DRAFT_19700 [Parachaetomium inaequale]